MYENEGIITLFFVVSEVSVPSAVVLVSTYNDVSDAQEIVETTYSAIEPTAQDLRINQSWIKLIDKTYIIFNALFLIIGIAVLAAIFNRLLYSIL